MTDNQDLGRKVLRIGLKLDSRKQSTEESDAAYRLFLEGQKSKHSPTWTIKDVFDAWQARTQSILEALQSQEMVEGITSTILAKTSASKHGCWDIEKEKAINLAKAALQAVAERLGR